jgi:anhydro-N-acetylmuramic acid kinase
MAGNMHEDRLVSKQQGALVRALGLMSGTSLDGIDVALLETDGEGAVKRGHAATYPYSPEFRAQLRAGLEEAANLTRRDERPGRLRMLEQYLTQLHAEAVGHYLADHQVPPDSVDVIGFHGQTVLHRPEARLSVQLGDGALLSRLCATDVVYDMRAADVEAGGQGAPLVPAYHMALVGKLPGPVAVVNIGGVANITWIESDTDKDRRLIAFDTGPGCALIDDWMRGRTGRAMDESGTTAAQGQVDESALAGLLSHPYFSMPPPKSLDRNAFGLDAIAQLSLEDGAATLAAFTAEAIARSAALVPEPPRTWIVSGGGRRNSTLMDMLEKRVAARVLPAEALGLNGDSVEAEAWAYLAVRSKMGLPITFPGTTGVSQPLTGGILAKAPR